MANDIHPATALVVRVTSSVGIRTFLGRVSPGATGRLLFHQSSFTGTFQLTAETAAGEEFVSRPFTLFRGSAVRWALPSNSLTVGVDPRPVDADSAP